MNDVIFRMIAIVFVLVAFATAFATLGASPTVRRITNRVIYGSCIAALGLGRAGRLVSLSPARVGLQGVTMSIVFWSAPRPNMPASDGDP
jgi:hypothetical protein